MNFCTDFKNTALKLSIKLFTTHSIPWEHQMTSVKTMCVLTTCVDVLTSLNLNETKILYTLRNIAAR